MKKFIWNPGGIAPTPRFQINFLISLFQPSSKIILFYFKSLGLIPQKKFSGMTVADGDGGGGDSHLESHLKI